MSALAATRRRNRSMYSRVALFAPMDETSGTQTAGQRRKRVRGKTDGIFTKRLEEDQAIDSLTPFYVPRLANQVTTYGTFVNFSSFSIPFYRARWDTQKIHVSDNPPRSQMDLDDSPYKWGTDANTPWEQGWRSADAEIGWYDESALGAGKYGYRDRSMVILDESNDELQEFYQVYRKGADRTNNPHDYPNITAEFGGRMRDLKNFNGIWPSGPGGSTGFGLSGTSVSYGTTFVLYDEAAGGVIPHAIPFAVSVGTSLHRLPATRGDQTGGTDDVPEGSRFRLPYDFDVEAWYLAHNSSPLLRMYLYAIRDYGLVVADASSGVVGFAVENLRPPPSYTTDSSPWLQFCTNRANKAFTGASATNRITSSGHGLSSGNQIIFDTPLVGGSGISVSPTAYYVTVIDSNTFQLYSNFSRTILVLLGSDCSGTWRHVQGASELFDNTRFPWSSLLLLPPQAAF